MVSPAILAADIANYRLSTLADMHMLDSDDLGAAVPQPATQIFPGVGFGRGGLGIYRDLSNRLQNQPDDGPIAREAHQKRRRALEEDHALEVQPLQLG
jgi:hypothetical protein